MQPHSRLFLLTVLLLAPALVDAQTRRADRPLVPNGDFSRFSTEQNLWDGVDSSGFLAVPRAELPLLREDGSVGATPVAPSVTVGDINGDGAPDLLVASPSGYIYAYFNQGTASEPKFSTAELLPVFFAIPQNQEATAGNWDPVLVRGHRIQLTNIASANQLDLLLGNYMGDVFILRNTGSPRAPAFSQPRNLADISFSLMGGGRVWANLIAPLAFDLTKNGALDMIVGEGSYSANSVHLFVNKGSTASPRFSGADRSFLVYGDGREQLAPAFVDWNADGFPDLLVGDRRGELSIHLHPGVNWKPGDDFPLTSMVTLGRSSRLGSAITPSVADMNGNGKFDILLGRINGRVSMAVNSGAPGKPKFETPVDLSGTDSGISRFKNPRGWSANTQFTRGNAYAYVSCVDATDDPQADPRVGGHVLKAGYHPPGNTVFPPLNFRTPPPRGANPVTNRTFILATAENVPLLTGTRFTLGFQAKGSGVRNARWQFEYTGRRIVTEGRQITGDRGDVSYVGREVAEQSNIIEGTFSVAGNWSQVTGSITPVFSDKRLSDLKVVSTGKLTIYFDLPEQTNVFYMDDVQMRAN